MDRCIDRFTFLENCTDFYDTHDQLLAWLTVITHLVSVLGPIASDPHLVHSQLQQVLVLEEDFTAHIPQTQQLKSLANSIILKIAETSSLHDYKISNRVMILDIKWADITGQLRERKQNLNALMSSSLRTVILTTIDAQLANVY